jgi:hypothetical protein
VSSYNTFEELKEEMINYLYELDDGDGKRALRDLVFDIDRAKVAADIPMEQFYKESRSYYDRDEKWVQIVHGTAL